jgi:TPR repeat protein
MKANQLARSFLCLLFILTLHGYGRGKDATSAEKLSALVTTNNSAPPSFNEIKVRAEHGDAKAQFDLGIAFAKGDGVAEDYVEAVKWFRKAAEQNNAEAQYELGQCYENDYGVAIDEVEAVKWYRKAAEQNYAKAQDQLGDCYEYGKGVEVDAVEAVKWYRKAAEQGNTFSQKALGEAYRDGNGVAKDDAEAVKWFRKSAEQGDFSGQLALGVMYELGRGVPQDSIEAYKWFHKAAGHPPYDDETIKLFLEAEKGYAKSQFALGSRFSIGLFVPADATEAVKWWLKAAEQGNARAQVSLGAAYENGRGVETNLLEAVKWWRKAAEQGVAYAQYSLGWAYQTGEGVPQNMTKAAGWFRRAAEQGDADAEFCLGMMYGAGEGVPQDFVEYYKWVNLAAAQGNTDAKKVRNRIVKSDLLTTEQIAEAQQLSREFVPRKKSGSANSASPENPTASGTGFFITDDGYLISNNHVVKDATQVRLVTSTGTIAAKVVRSDAANDLVLLKADGKFSPLSVAASRGVKLGGTVATVGFPNIGLQGFAPKLAKGEIASLSGAQDDPRYFQISVPVQPGNSGGALVDEHGNVVGVVSAKLDASVALAASGALPENVNYAVKSSFLLSFLESVPAVSTKLKEPVTVDRKFEDVVKSAQDAAVLVLVY